MFSSKRQIFFHFVTNCKLNPKQDSSNTLNHGLNIYRDLNSFASEQLFLSILAFSL